MRKVPSELGRWELLKLPSSAGDTSQMRLLHELAKIRATFDDLRYHAIFTDSPFVMLQAEEHHRGHA